jgi:peptide/nickel transport system substrate-binding protein
VSNREKLSRRDFLRAAAMMTAGVAAVACQPQTVVVKETVEVEKVVKETVQVEVEVEKEVTKVVEKEVTKVVEKMIEVTPPPEEIREAPELFGRVAAGDLPPVADRLPAEPLVLVRGDGFEQEIGSYGGSLRLLEGQNAANYQPEYMLMLDRHCTGTIPNIAKGWEFGDEGKSLTIYLRKGTKWSDGAPFGADDIMFWWEDNLANEDLNAQPASWWRPRGERMEVEKIDDFTVRYSFAVPYWSVLHSFDSSGFRGCQSPRSAYQPKHFLQQFHLAYNKEANELAKSGGYEDWIALFKYWEGSTEPVGVPTLTAWVKARETPTGVDEERNPYYFKVDPEGNQLPYVDRINASYRGDAETIIMQIVSGQVDFEAWGLQIVNYPVMKANEEKGGYDAWLGVDLWSAAAAFHLNHNYNADPEIGDLLRDVQFRRALSVAINREEIKETVFLGFGRPVQVTVTPDSPWYKDEWAQAYAQYDPDQANAWLDEIGLTQRDAEGFRTKPSGGELSIVIEFHTVNAYYPAISEMVKDYWDAVGIRTILSVQDRSLIWPRQAANEQQVFVWVWDGASTFMVPLGTGNMSRWCPLWNAWWTSEGESGEEPPAEIKALFEVADTLAYSDDEGVAEAANLIYGDLAENVRCIGGGTASGKPCISSKGLGNVDFEAHADSYDIGGVRNNWLELMFWKE